MEGDAVGDGHERTPGLNALEEACNYDCWGSGRKTHKNMRAMLGDYSTHLVKTSQLTSTRIRL